MLFVNGGGDKVQINNASTISGEGVLQVTGIAANVTSVWQVGTNGQYLIQFKNASNGHIGSIGSASGSVSFNTTSDYRLKENVVDMEGAINRLKNLNPSRFNFIREPDLTVDGFLAHEVSDIVPEAIEGEKDAMMPAEVYTEEDEPLPEGKSIGDAKPAEMRLQGIDQAKLVPLLVGALQEAVARIEVLENA
jgi:hypothetical protein